MIDGLRSRGQVGPAVGVLCHGSGVLFGDVEVPPELMASHAAGRLVIFVGAGASKGEPSGLPLFVELTELVAADANQELSEEDRRRPDVYLGRLDDEQIIDVHARVAHHLGRESSRPNALHEAVIELALAGPKPKVVTTNYDGHLSTAWRASHPEYVAPALPVGDDFDGLVYLHGRLPAGFVVTDADFGRAYLRDAWAARFLDRMFSEFDVLFVGYSHDDIIVSYLGRSLGARRGTRYALTEDPGLRTWRGLNISPLAFGNDDQTFTGVVTAVRSWARHASMGVLAHAETIVELTTGPPPLIPQQDSYLRGILRNPDLVPSFCNRQIEPPLKWLEWIADIPEFENLFDRRAILSPSSRAFCQWFINNHVLHDSESKAALDFVLSRNWEINPHLAFRLAAVLSGADFGSSPAMRYWLLFLLQHIQDSETSELSYVLTAPQLPADLALMILERITRPRLTAHSPFLALAAATFEVDLDFHGDTEEYFSEEAWREHKGTWLQHSAREFVEFAARRLDDYFRLEATCAVGRDRSSPVFNSASAHRDAIEQDDASGYRTRTDLLIDIARDGVAALTINDRAYVDAVVQQWMSSSNAVLRRLALNALTTDAAATPAAQWSILLDSELLFDWTCRREALRLAKEALTADPSLPIEAVLATAMQRLRDEDDPYSAMSLLSVLVATTGYPPNVAAALEEIRTTYPEFTTDDVQDVELPVSEGELVFYQPPMTVAELHTALHADSSAAVADLLTLRSAPRQRMGSPSWGGALDLVRQVSETYPSDGLTLVRAPGGEILLAQVLAGWQDAELSVETAEELVAGVADLKWDDESTRTLARLLADPPVRHDETTDWYTRGSIRDIARHVWDRSETMRPSVTPSDAVIDAINHPAGHVAEFWIRAIQSEWRQAGDEWHGMPSHLDHQLTAMLATSDHRSEYFETMLAAQTYFLAAADYPWTVEHVLPLFDWTDDDRTWRSVRGQLTWGKLSARLLDAGLERAYLGAAERASHLDPPMRRQLFSHLATATLIPDHEGSRLASQITRLPTSERVSWLESLGFQLRNLPPEIIDSTWRRWLRSYVAARVDETLPPGLAPDEVSAIATWLPSMPDQFIEAVALLLAAGPSAGVGRRGTLEQLKKAEGLDGHSLALLLDKLLADHEGFVVCTTLNSLVDRVKAATSPATISSLKSSAIRLGCTDAVGW